MEIINITAKPPADTEPLVLVIGKFDGIHKGHEAILQTAGEQMEKGDTLAVFSFSDHPRWVLAQDPFFKDKITPEPEKIRLLRNYHVGRYYQVAFTAGYAATTAEQFVLDHLSVLNIKRVIVGEGFRFGKGGTAGTDELAALCRQIGVEVSIVPLIKENGKKISSSTIRQSIRDGAMEAVHSLLGRPYTITGEVIHGEKLGRQLGFPTANLGGTDAFVPLKAGVYLTTVGIYQDGIIQEYWHALVNAGYRPTVAGKGYLIEANLLNFSGDLYGKTVAVSFLHFLREESHFSSLELLVEQMHKDKKRAEQLLTGK